MMTQEERNNIFKSIGFIEAMYTFNGYIDSDTYKRYKNLCQSVNEPMDANIVEDFEGM